MPDIQWSKKKKTKQQKKKCKHPKGDGEKMITNQQTNKRK